jgi:hypothetical protein
VANLVDGSGDAGSNLVQGRGTNSATFPMPNNVPLAVSSVLATINNAAGGDTTAELVVRDSSGEVIATKRQSEVIPAGGTGTATFALRLTDEGAAGAAGIEFDTFPQAGTWLYIETTGSDPNTGNGLDLVAAKVINIQTVEDVFVTARSSQQSFDGDYQIQAAQSGTGSLLLQSQDEARVEASNLISIDAAAAGDVRINMLRLGFFGAGPVAQQATPVTLANVISLLQAYGLAA